MPSLTTWSERQRDWLCLALLFALIVPFRGWLVYNTEVAARDSVGYVRYALHFEEFSYGEVLRRHHQHPGYPLAVWAVSLPVRALHGTTPESMQLSAQLASSLAAILLMVPMFLIGKRLFTRQVGFWSALWFQILPVCAHHLSDGISEGWFLLFVAWALYEMLIAFDTWSAGRFMLAGLFGGLAYLTRPEGALVIVSASMVMAVWQILPRRQAWGPWFRAGASMTATALLVGGFYFGFTGQFTNKPSFKQTIGQDPEAQPAPGPINAQFAAPPFLQANLWAAFIERSDALATRFTRGVSALTTELTHGFHYFGMFAALAGLWWFGPHLRRIPGSWVYFVYGALQTLILIALSMTAYYVSDRHVLILIFIAIAPATAGLIETPRRLLAWRPTAARVVGLPGWTLAVLLAAMIFCLPKSLQRIHGNRAGNHAAGRWLAKTVIPGDIVVDDHSWSHYYAGQLFLEGKDPVLPRGHQPTCYIVMTRSKADDIAKQRDLTEEKIKADEGQVVYHWPETRAVTEARVVVYAKPRRRHEHPWHVAP